MIYYHGSIVPNLKTLQPFNHPYSNSDRRCVYLTSNKQLAIFYLWVRRFMWLTYEINENNIPVYTETFQNNLEEFYNDVKGYIYSCEVSDDVENESGIKTAITIYDEVPIKSCECINNAYEKILEYEKEGSLILRRFKTLTSEELEKNTRMIKGAIKGLDLLAYKHPLSGFVEKKFPDIWQLEKKLKESS